MILLSTFLTGLAGRWLWRRCGGRSNAYFDVHHLPTLNALLTRCGLEPLEQKPMLAPPLSERVKRVYEVREDLRKVFPFALTPKQRDEYGAWLLTFGRDDFGLTRDEVLAFLFECAADPSHGLQATYLLTPEWQRAVPHALTVFGWDELRRYLASTHGLTDQWVRRLRLTRPYRAADELRLLLQARPTLAPSFPKDGDVVAIRAWIRSHRELVMPNAQWFAELSQYLPDRLSVNVLAHFRYPSGLQEAAVNVVRGLESVDVRTIRRDLPVHFPSDWSDQERYQGVELSDVTIFNGAINRFLDEYIPHAGLHLRGGVYRIAIWYWELEKLPAEWVERIEKHHLIDEVWAPTKFIADAVRSHLKLPVFPMLPGLELPPFTPQPRERFGLDASKFLFLFMFDMNSDMNRKNPLGLIAAFQKAFGSRTDVQLAIKVSRGDSHKRNQSLLIDACRNAGVVLMDEVLPRNDVLALLNTADCYVSLHRSEGFGLTMAESMLLGKPTIGTAYSGNLDFMTSETSYLVDYERVPIVDELSFYPQGCMWADPSIEHAVQLMRRVFENRDEARRIGEAGQKSLRELLSVRSAGERMLARLRELDQDS